MLIGNVILVKWSALASVTLVTTVILVGSSQSAAKEVKNS